VGWIRVEDDFYDNDKMTAAGSIGRDLYWHGMAYCNRNLTDGLIAKGRALLLVDYTDAAVVTGTHAGVDGAACAPYAVERLLAAGLWHAHGHDCPTCVQPGARHYVVHDYLHYQPSRAQVEAKSEANRERVRKWTAKQKEEANAAANALANASATPPLQTTPTPTPTPTPSSTGVVAYVGAHKPAHVHQQPAPPNVVAQRGTRLDPEWRPTQPVIDGIKAECRGLDLAAEHRKFVDHWIAQPGQRGVKLDWHATWRNWMRRAGERSPGRAKQATSELRLVEGMALVESYATNNNNQLEGHA
jgi:hypothetical protein